MEKTTMSNGLQECWNTPLVPTTSVESFNTMNLQTQKETLSDSSKSIIPVRSGYNSRKRARMSGKHNAFVLGFDGNPLTPTTNAKAKKLMKGKQAKPRWNKFGQFGIQMLVDTRKEIPKTVLGIDFGTKFEGYTVSIDKENNSAIMWKLPDKKKLVKKLEERRRLRRARRFRNCRRRKCRFQNRKKTFIAPSQKQIINSRLRCINEIIKYYPIGCVALEDVKFNHKKYRYGKNFTTLEIGKAMINNFFIEKGIKINKFQGHETQELRKKYGYHKLRSDKSRIDFRTHCSDALAISTEVMDNGYIKPIDNFIYVDDSYRCIRRRLYDTQYSKGGIRYKFSSGNFQGISKGCIIGFEGGSGQLVGGTKDNCWYQDFEMKGKRKIYQKGKSIKKLMWLSHDFKYKRGSNSSTT